MCVVATSVSRWSWKCLYLPGVLAIIEELMEDQVMLPVNPHYSKQLSPKDISYSEEISREVEKVPQSLIVDSPFLYMDRKNFATCLTRIRLYDLARNIQGCIVECGVHRANSFFLYHHMAATLDPLLFNKKIIGFDTFEGFTSISEKDPCHVIEGGLCDTSFEHIDRIMSLQDRNRLLGHVPTVELVKGDACKKIPEYVEANPWLIISLLYLDFDIYEPTVAALEHLAPLVPKGGVIAFDELNQRKWGGETIAFKEHFDLNKVNLRKFNFEPHVSYFVVE